MIMSLLPFLPKKILGINYGEERNWKQNYLEKG